LPAAVAAIPDFRQWSAGEKRQMDEVIRAKSAPDEIDYVRAMQRHGRFRDAILRLGLTHSGIQRPGVTRGIRPCRSCRCT
jgi:hypothetical protein